MIASIEELAAVHAQKAPQTSIGGEATLLFASRILTPLFSNEALQSIDTHDTWLESAAELLGEQWSTFFRMV